MVYCTGIYHMVYTMVYILIYTTFAWYIPWCISWYIPYGIYHMVYTNGCMVYTIQKWYIPGGNLPDGNYESPLLPGSYLIMMSNVYFHAAFNVRPGPARWRCIRVWLGWFRLGWFELGRGNTETRMITMHISGYAIHRLIEVGHGERSKTFQIDSMNL
jgi:hypothetical protein